MKNKYLVHREALGLTQQEVANRCGVTVRTVSRWETGASDPHNIAFYSEQTGHVSTGQDIDMVPEFITRDWWKKNGTPYGIYEPRGKHSEIIEGPVHPRNLWSIPPNTPIPVNIIKTQEYKDAAAARLKEIGDAFQAALRKYPVPSSSNQTIPYERDLLATFGLPTIKKG